MTDTDNHVVRPPLQERSRLTWERVLAVGQSLLEEGGIDAVTMSEVCRRAGITAPSLYARVDSLAGLIAAVFERGMDAVHTTEAEILAASLSPDAPLPERVNFVVDFISQVFEEHHALLRSVIMSSVRDTRIHARGAEEARRVQGVMALQLGDVPERDAREVASTMFAEVLVRAVYGGEFSVTAPESDSEFRARLRRMGIARLSQ